MLRTYLMYNTVVRLCHFFVVAGKFVITTGKKSSSRLSGGCAIVITTGKNKVLVAIVITTGKKKF